MFCVLRRQEIYSSANAIFLNIVPLNGCLWIYSIITVKYIKFQQRTSEIPWRYTSLSWQYKSIRISLGTDWNLTSKLTTAATGKSMRWLVLFFGDRDEDMRKLQWTSTLNTNSASQKCDGYQNLVPDFHMSCVVPTFHLELRFEPGK